MYIIYSRNPPHTPLRVNNLYSLMLFRENKAFSHTSVAPYACFLNINIYNFNGKIGFQRKCKKSSHKENLLLFQSSLLVCSFIVLWFQLPK